MFTLTNSTVYF